MNIAKMQLILRKLNKLVEGIDEGEGSVSAIERDLYRSYLTQLYDLSLNVDLRKEEEEDPVIIFSEEDYAPRKEEEKPAASQVPIETQEPVDEVKSAEKPKETAEMSPEKTEEVSETTNNHEDIRDSIKSLFKSKQTVEISDQLSQRPVNDISKAMSINDRMLTINQLFAGSETSFRTTLDKLNSMASYEEAKEYLMQDIATSNDWDKGERPEAAELFINLVHRKFSH